MILRVHSWGNNLAEAFINSAHAMVNYMYERGSVEETERREIKVEGIDCFVLFCIVLYCFDYCHYIAIAVMYEL